MKDSSLLCSVGTMLMFARIKLERLRIQQGMRMQVHNVHISRAVIRGQRSGSSALARADASSSQIKDFRLPSQPPKFETKRVIIGYYYCACVSSWSQTELSIRGVGQKDHSS